MAANLVQGAGTLPPGFMTRTSPEYARWLSDRQMEDAASVTGSRGSQRPDMLTAGGIYAGRGKLEGASDFAWNPDTFEIQGLDAQGRPIEGQRFSHQTNDSDFFNSALAMFGGAALAAGGAFGGLGASGSGAPAAASTSAGSGGLYSGLSSLGAETAGTSGLYGGLSSLGLEAPMASVANLPAFNAVAGVGAGAGEVGSYLNAIFGAAGLAQQISAAGKAQSTADRAVDAQTQAAQNQANLAQQQWDFYKNTYLPKAMQQADDQLALSKQITQDQLDNSQLARGIAGDSFDQAKKSWKYQDQMMQLADDYSSGKVSNTMADQNNADVNQSFASAEGDMMRQAQRYGLNPGSGGFSAALGDLYQQKALALAGGATAARRYARDKAESLVATAAGAGQAGFGTGIQAQSLVNGGLAGASQTNATSGYGLNQVAGTFGAGANGASANYGNAGVSWNSAVRNAQIQPFTDYVGGLLSGGAKGAGYSGAAPNYWQMLGSGLNGLFGSGSGG